MPDEITFCRKIAKMGKAKVITIPTDIAQFFEDRTYEITISALGTVGHSFGGETN